MIRSTCLLLPLLLHALTSAGALAVVDTEFFEKKIRPLLHEHCLGCHGAEKQKGNLRLDHAAGWRQGGDSGPAIQPGKTEESLFWRAVSYDDRDLKMPPKKKLSEAELADLKVWIAQGAYDPRTEIPGAKTHAANTKADESFWSFQPAKKQPLPELRQSDWPLNQIDHFILAKLEQKGLKPSPEAAATTLRRRLSMDLTGLPPEKVGQPQSWEAEVDALLASPAFAERWASHFMDMTRFAESSGGGRSLPFKDAWRFRDYLLHSLRDDVPLDRMITEMIAGDLLPYENAAQRRRQLTATGFLVLGPTNYEEQDKGMLRMDIVDEQLDTLGKSFLGMTLGCARCHDHKFDPIPTRDYYALAGILRSTRTLKNYTDNVAHWIDTPLPFDGAQEAELVKHETVLHKLQAETALLKDQLRDAGSVMLRKKRQILAKDLPGVVVDDSEAQKVGAWKASNRYPPFIGGGYLHDENLGKGEKTLTFTPKLPAPGRYEVRLAFSGGPGRAPRIAATVLHADGEDLVYCNQATEALNGLQFTTLGTWRFEASGQNFVMISNAGAEGYVTVDAVQFLPAETEMPDMPVQTQSMVEKELKGRLAELEKQIQQLKKTAPARPEAMTVAEDEKPEDARIHIRGSIRNLGNAVPRGFLQVASRGPAAAIANDQSGRLQLAEWITRADNPLTARVLVNRVWHWVFGAGIVRTTDNFGSTGEAPSHPELLDHLALTFVQEGWSLKKLVKYLVMSRTYRQSSEIIPGVVTTIDPDNRLLSRMNRKRLDAECLRDAMVAAAGALDRTFGGQNIQGGNKVDANDTKVQNLEYGFQFLDTRRSVYTAAFRNVRHPLFEVFDFADINQPIGQRTTSTVATQALFLLNNPQVIEQAQSAAEQLLRQAEDAKARVRLAYQRCLSREPSAVELDKAVLYLEAQRSGNDEGHDVRDHYARLIQVLWSTPEFRFLD